MQIRHVNKWQNAISLVGLINILSLVPSSHGSPWQVSFQFSMVFSYEAVTSSFLHSGVGNYMAKSMMDTMASETAERKPDSPSGVQQLQGIWRSWYTPARNSQSRGEEIASFDSFLSTRSCHGKRLPQTCLSGGITRICWLWSIIPHTQWLFHSMNKLPQRWWCKPKACLQDMV